jgi:hypothetical protein
VVRRLIWCDAFRQFPDLTLSLTEGDMGWIPYFLWRAEHVLDRHHGWTGHSFLDGIEDPANVFRRDLLCCCFIKEPIGLANLVHFNIDNVCWESAFPHSDGTWPEAPEVLSQILRGLDDEKIDKITHANATRHYQLDPFATRDKEACRVGALRAASPEVDAVTRVGRLAGERDLAAWAKISACVAANR